MRNQKGFATLSLAVLVGIVLLAGIAFIMNQSSNKSAMISKQMRTEQQFNAFEIAAQKRASTIRQLILDGDDPETICPKNLTGNVQNDKLVESIEDIIKPDMLKVWFTCQTLETGDKSFILTGYEVKNTGTTATPNWVLQTSKSIKIKVSAFVDIGVLESVNIGGGQVERYNDFVKGKLGSSSTSPAITMTPADQTPADKTLKTIYVRDTIYTPDNTIAILKMKDGTKISLSPKSTFSFERFKFHKVDARKTVYKLWDGLYHAIFSHIQVGEDQVVIQSPTASMGVRGTEIIMDVESRTDSATGEKTVHTTVTVLDGKVKVVDSLDIDELEKIPLSNKIICKRSSNEVLQLNTSGPTPLSETCSIFAIDPKTSAASNPTVAITGDLSNDQKIILFPLGSPEKFTADLYSMTKRKKIHRENRLAKIMWAYYNGIYDKKLYAIAENTKSDSLTNFHAYVTEVRGHMAGYSINLVAPPKAMKFENFKNFTNPPSTPDLPILLTVPQINKVPTSITSGISTALIYKKISSDIDVNNSYVLINPPDLTKPNNMLLLPELKEYMSHKNKYLNLIFKNGRFYTTGGQVVSDSLDIRSIYYQYLRKKNDPIY